MFNYAYRLLGFVLDGAKMMGKRKGRDSSLKKGLSRRMIIIIVAIAVIAVLASLAYLYIPDYISGKKTGGGGGGGNNTTQTGTPPVARFTASATHVDVGDTIVFNASTSYDPDGEILSYRWDFGDATVRVTDLPEVNHTYTVHGIYTVNLTVTDNDGLADTASLTVYVSLKNETLGPYGEILLSRENPIFHNSTSINFTLQEGVESLRVNISAVGLSYEEDEQRIGNATLRVVLYDPFLREVMARNYTYRGQREMEFRPDTSLLTVLPGEYTLEFVCISGTTRIVFTVFINYTPL